MKALLLLFTPIFLFATSLETLINHAKNNHNSLKTLEQRVLVVESDIARSQNFADPMLSLSMGDIQFNDVLDRTREPMQYTAVALQQKISYFGKRHAKQAKLEAEKKLSELGIDAMKIKLVQAIKLTAYDIWKIEEDLKIVDEYFKLTKQNIELSSGYASSDSSSHMGIMSAEMTLSELRIKYSKLSSTREALYKNLSYLSAMEVTQIDLDLSIQKHKHIDLYQKVKHQNLTYKSKLAKLQVQNKNITIKELEKYPDPTIQVGYFQRQKYNDYMNLSVSFPLPIYGSQDLEIQKAQKLSLAAQSEVADTNQLLDAQITKIHSKIEDAFRVYDIIQNQSMPQIQHMFDLSSTSIKNGEELFVYLNLLERKLKLDEKSIEVIANYNKYLAQLDALIGEMQ